MTSEALVAENSLLEARRKTSRFSSRNCDSTSAPPAFPASPASLCVSSLIVSGLLGTGASGVGAAWLVGAFCSGAACCSPDFFEEEVGRADAGVCGAVAGEGCTSFFLAEELRSRLQVEIKTIRHLSDKDTGFEGRK